MIIRNRRINPGAAEIMLHISYGLPDLKAAFKRYFALLVNPCGATFATSVGNSEPEVFHFLCRDIFSQFTGDMQKQLCRWAITQAEKNGLVFRGANNDFYLNPALGKKVGRPKTKNDE